MSNKIELFKKDNTRDILALKDAKEQVKIFEQIKPVYRIYSRKRKMWLQTTSLDRYNELKIENEVKV